MKRPFVRFLLLLGAFGVSASFLSAESVNALSSQFHLDTRSVAVGNVSVSPSGSSSVVVTYDLASSFGKADVEIAVSSDEGCNFETLGASVFDPASNVGAAVLPGNGRRVVWRVAESFPGSLLPDVRIRVRGIQGGVTREAFSGRFTVDTRLTQNLKIDDIVVPAEILTGAECQGTVIAKAVTVPTVPVLLQITAGSVPIAVRTVPVNAWAAYAGAYAANIPFVWRPQEDQCREMSLAAMIDPLNDNRVAESEERTDNEFQRNVRVRVRQVLGNVNGYTVYADILNRQAFQTAMKENGAGLYGALVAGSVEVERNGLPVVDSAKVVATLDALAAQLTEGARYSGRYHLSRRDKNLPVVYDNSMAWGIVDPLGNVVDSLLPDAAAAASARKDILVSSVLQTSSVYDSVKLLCDLVPALIGGIGCFKGIGKLSENNTSIFKDVTRLDYRMYITYVNEVLSFDVLDDENSTISEPLLIEVARLVTDEVEASKITIDRDMVIQFIKEILRATKKDLEKEFRRYLPTIKPEQPVTCTMEAAIRARAAATLCAMDKIRVFREALGNIYYSVPNEKREDVYNWCIACDSAIEELNGLYRQQMCVIDPLSDPESFGKLLNDIGNVLASISMKIVRNRVEDTVKLALKETAILVATRLGNKALASTIGSKVAAPLIGLEAGRLLTNFDSLDEYRDNVFLSGQLIKDYVDEFWYLARYDEAVGSNPQVSCHLLAALRSDLYAYSSDQTAMFCESGFYGLMRYWPGGAEGIAHYRTMAEEERKRSSLISSVTSPREAVLYGLLASSAAFNCTPGFLADALPERSMEVLRTMEASCDKHWFFNVLFPLASLNVDSHFFSNGTDFEDGLRRLFLHPSWSFVAIQFGGRMEMKVEELAADGSVLCWHTQDSDGGVLRQESAADGFYWDDWAITLNPNTHAIRVSMRGLDWTKLVSTWWTTVATVDCSRGAAMSSLRLAANPGAAILGETLPEEGSSIVVTNWVPVDADTNGLAEAVRIEGYCTPAQDLAQVFISVDVVDTVFTNAWRCLYGPFAATGGLERALSLDLAGVYVTSSAFVRVSLLDAAFTPIATAPQQELAFGQSLPAQCGPLLVNGGFDSVRRDEGWDCNVSWSMLADETNGNGQAQVIVRAFDTNGVCSVLSQICLIWGQEETAGSGMLFLPGEPAYATVLILDDRHVLVETRDLVGTVNVTTRIDAVQPQTASDGDGDGYDERIPVRILLAGGEAGAHSILLTCTDGSDTVLHEELADIERSADASQWVTVNVPVSPLVFSGVLPPWTLQTVRWFKDDGTLLAVSALAVDLDVPARPLPPPVRFNGSNVWSVVTDARGVPAALRVSLGVESDITGMMWGSAALTDSSTNTMCAARASWEIAAFGAAALLFDFDLARFQGAVPSGPYLVRDIEIWSATAGRLGRFRDGFEIGGDILSEDLTRPADALSGPVSITPQDPDSEGLFTHVGISLGATVQEDGIYSLDLLCAGSVTNTIRLDSLRLEAGASVVTTNFPAEHLSGLETPDSTVLFLRARLIRGSDVCAELGLTNTLPLTGMRVQPPVVDAVVVAAWAEVIETGPGIDALDVHVDWVCSRSSPVTVSLRLDTVNRSAAWSSSLPVDAGGGANRTVFRYPGWLFWSANLSNALVAARFEARSPDGTLLGFAENFATSGVFQASQFAGCPLPELEVISLQVSPVTNQAGVVSGSERFQVSAVLRNTGDAAAEACRAQGTAISAGASMLFANIAVPGLYTGEEWTVTFFMERGRGPHDISLAIDPDMKVTERNRLNNVMTRSVLIPLDTDGDGLPDLWEHTNFGDFLSGRADDDPDHDGAPNWHELGAGTSPTNAASRFVFEAVNTDGAGLLLNWQSAPGKRYRVWWTGNLNNWDQANSEAVGETGSWQALPYAGNTRFFRVTIEE